MSDFEFELGEDGELIVSEQARSTVLAAMKKAVSMAKNDSEFTDDAYSPPEGEDRQDHDETELTPAERERRARRLRRDPAAHASVAVGERVHEKRSAIMSADELLDVIGKRGLGFQVVKRFAEVGTDELNEAQITDLLLAEWGREFGKRFQAQDAEGRIAREAVAKARDAQFNTVSVAPAVVHGRDATAVNRPTAADAARARIIEEQRHASPFWSDEQLEVYARGLQAELERAARGKQERARPGTLERV